MPRTRSIVNALWPASEEFVALATRLSSDAINVLYGAVWVGYDVLYREALKRVNWDQDYEQLERSITQLLVPRIRDAMGSFTAFDVEQGVFEYETSFSRQAQPPQYDIAFVLRDNPSVMYPLEAKVLCTDGTLAEYIAAIRERFLNAKYAPFSSESGMLAYLLSGQAQALLANIGKGISAELEPYAAFPTRDHMVSNHVRQVPAGKKYPVRFRCHHLVLRMGLRQDA